MKKSLGQRAVIQLLVRWPLILENLRDQRQVCLLFEIDGFLSYLIKSSYNARISLKTALRDNQGCKFFGDIHVGKLERATGKRAAAACSGPTDDCLTGGKRFGESAAPTRSRP